MGKGCRDPGPRDPEGYYVVVIERGRPPRLVGDDRLEEAGGRLLYRTRSRARALRALRRQGCR